MAEPTTDNARSEHAARQRVLDAIDAREVADFSGLPEAERRIDADFLQRLIAGTNPESGGLCCALRVRGAVICGPLRPPSRHGVTPVPVQFWDCRFDAPVDFSGAEFLLLRFTNCELPAFIGPSLRVSADLDFSGSHFSGERSYESELSQVEHCAIHLNHARIGGKLDLSSTANSRFTAADTVRLDGAEIEGEVCLSGASITGSDAPAVSARAATIGDNFSLNPAHGHRCEVHGEIILSAAHIAGDLDCRGARIINPDGRALHCEDIKVESALLSATREDDLFEAHGRLNFLTATMGGSFFLNRARLVPGPDHMGMLGTGGRVAVNLQQARISNALVMNDVREVDPDSPDAEPVPVRGWFLLTAIQASALIDDMQTGWPAHGFLDLDGAMIERIRHTDADQLAEKRIEWLRRQYVDGKPTAASFRPQPYEMLSNVLRHSGLVREANSVAVEKIRARLESHVDRFWARFFPNLLMMVSKHGYSSGRAILSFALFVLIGAGFYALALFGFGQEFWPTTLPAEPVTYRFAFDLLEQSAAQGCPGLDVMHYALDAALPVIDLAQDTRCQFSPQGPMRSLWLVLHSAYVLIGTALSAVVVLTLTGVLRQD